MTNGPFGSRIKIHRFRRLVVEEMVARFPRARRDASRKGSKAALSVTSMRVVPASNVWKSRLNTSQKDFNTAPLEVSLVKLERTCRVHYFLDQLIQQSRIARDEGALASSAVHYPARNGYPRP
jgi:hypothetical protein